MPVFKKDRTVQIVVNTSNDKWIIDKGMTLDVSGTPAIFQNTAFANADIIVRGEIINDDPAMFAVMLDGTLNTVTVEKSGSIDAIKGIYAGPQGTVENLGRIIVDETGIEATAVKNSGLIRADTAVTLRDLFGGVEIGRSGEIHGSQYGIYEDSNTVTEIVNRGLLHGDVAAVFSFSSSEMTFKNFGVVKGAVMMGDGDDLFINKGGRTGPSEIWGGDGDDFFRIDRAGVALRESAGEGYDSVQSTASISLSDNFEKLTLLGKKEIQGFGNNETNLIIDINSAATVIKGFGGVDQIHGGTGKNTLYGGAGDDLIYSGAGNEKFFGEEDADIFVFNPGCGKDVIMDFADLADLIDLSDYDDFPDAASLAGRVTMSGADTLITLLNGDSIRLKNFDINDLQAGDFIF
jgi:Ca2+-binding RTX toxin-like protein